MIRVVVIGASGFGREALDVVEAMIEAGADVQIVGVVDDTPSPTNLDRLETRGVSYLGTRHEWLGTDVSGAQYILGIGAPAVRRRLAGEFDSVGLVPFTAVHPSATVGACTVFGQGVVVCAGVAISNNVRLSAHVHVNPNATIGHDACLGEFASINPAAVISGEVNIRSGSLIGAGAVVLQNLVVGSGVTVGAGSVVTKNIPNDVVAVGVPARW